MNLKRQQRGRLVMVMVTAGLLGIVYALQVGQSAVGWAVVMAGMGLLVAQTLSALRLRPLWANLLLGAALGLLMGALLGLPAVPLGAMVGEAAALLVSVWPTDQPAVSS